MLSVRNDINFDKIIVWVLVLKVDDGGQAAAKFQALVLQRDSHWAKTDCHFPQVFHGLNYLSMNGK